MTQSDIQLFDPQTLYRRWEDSQWNPFEIDLRRDKEQWAGLAREDQDLIYWVLAQLMVAEERITTKFSGLVGAYGSAEEATFLSTQQVDEARHMQFYARFQDEVIAEPATVSVHVERAGQEVTPPPSARSSMKPWSRPTRSWLPLLRTWPRRSAS